MEECIYVIPKVYILHRIIGPLSSTSECLPFFSSLAFDFEDL